MGGVKNHPDVTLVSRIFAPEAAAASFRLEALVNALAQQGLRVSVLTTIPAPGTDWNARSRVDNYPNVRVQRVQAKRDKTGYIRGYLSYMSFDIPAFFRLLFRVAPQIYVVEPPPTTGAIVRLVAALKRRPYVYYAADIWSEAAVATAPKPVVTLLRMVERFALRGAAEIIAISSGVAEQVKRLGARRIRVVENGIDTDIFTPDGEPPRPLPQADPQEGDWLVYAGTASEFQGAEIFVDAFLQIADQYPKARLLFLGQGTAFEYVRAASRRLEPGRIVSSQVDPVQAAAWQRTAKVCLVSLRPGLGYDFAYPTKLLAALASGTPVLFVGKGPGARDVREFQLGLAVAYDVDAVAQAMRQFLNNEVKTGNLREWVLEHRSLSKTGEEAARVVSDVRRQIP